MQDGQPELRGGVAQGLAEGLEFGRRSGLDMEKALAVIGKGAAASWQMENRAKTMLEGKFDCGFAVDWMRKDFAICLALAVGTCLLRAGSSEVP